LAPPPGGLLALRAKRLINQGPGPPARRAGEDTKTREKRPKGTPPGGAPEGPPGRTTAPALQKRAEGRKGPKRGPETSQNRPPKGPTRADGHPWAARRFRAAERPETGKTGKNRPKTTPK